MSDLKKHHELCDIVLIAKTKASNSLEALSKNFLLILV